MTLEQLASIACEVGVDAYCRLYLDSGEILFGKIERVNEDLALIETSALGVNEVVKSFIPVESIVAVSVNEAVEK